jgi:pyruvate ferredoxin oxidoreductase alpha subunit
MGEKKFITGDTAVAHAVRQTPIAETLATFVGSGQLDAEYIRVESEHSALAACLGGCMAGVRSFTATASHGLAYMHEMLTYVAGGRFPIVLAIAGRSIGPPWSIWGEQQDSIQQRDTGCIQIYVETAQEAFDTILQAFKIAENPRVFTPVLVCLDGFHVSHAQELVEVSTLDEVRKFLPPFNTSVTLDPDEPMSLAIGASGKQYATWRFEQYQALEAARTVIEEVDREFGEVFGRSYGGLVDAYRCDQAELIIVIMGSFAGMARDVVDSMRSKGVKAGLLRLRAFRPFPGEAVRNYLSSTRNVIVIDRDFSYGNEGAVCTEVKAAIFNLSLPPTILNFIGGLGGADITAEEIESLAEKFMRKGIEGDHKVVFQFMGGDK